MKTSEPCGDLGSIEYVHSKPIAFLEVYENERFYHDVTGSFLIDVKNDNDLFRVLQREYEDGRTDSNIVPLFRMGSVPARCDELKTVAKLGGLNGVTLIRHLENMLPEYVEKNYKDELVTRQNAEEVIAAKDARIAELEGDANVALAFATNPTHAMKALEADNKRLRDALTLAANRLHRLSIEPIEMAYDASEWKDEARAVLAEVKP